MKLVSKIPKPLLILLILSGILLLTALTIPGNNLGIQATEAPTQTPTPTIAGGEIPLKSGDTQGLIWGAVVILSIILVGVLIQRLLLKKASSDQE
jgi:hypothetical protein